MQHPNARLTPRGRLELVLLVERGASLRFAAAACNVALSTAHRSGRALARGNGGGAKIARVPAGSLQQAASQPAAACRRAAIARR